MLRNLTYAFVSFTLSFGLSQSANAQQPAQQPVKKTAQSTVPKNNASILLRWIDARGNLFPGGRVTKMAWIWSRISDSDAFDSPALRLWVTSRLPATWRPKKVTSDGVTIIEPFREGGTQTMVFDLRTTNGTLRFDFANEQGVITEMTLAINVTVTRPYILVRPECNKNDLKFLVHRSDAKHLFVGLSCIDLGDSFDIYFFRSRDSSWNNSPGLVQFDPDGRYTAFKYHVPKPKAQVVYSQRLFRVGTVDLQTHRTEYSIFYSPRVMPSKFYMSAGLGMTFYNYTEQATNLTSTQFSLTGKVNIGYRLIPRVLDIAFNGFGNLVTLSHSTKSDSTTGTTTTDYPDARFFGLNGRLGYRLPLDLGATEFMFLTGWYFWSMIVQDAAYGITSLSGPQVFVTMLNSQAGHAGWWWYFKFALIAERLNLGNIKNNELASGLGFELSKRESKPFSLTLDIARAQYTSLTGDNGMRLVSVTAGVQKSL